MTQEELAETLFVSRTAISKWESGRGYPNIDSLKSLAKFFSVTVDELLSGDEILSIAEEETRKKETRFRDLVFGLLDLSGMLCFFLPLFAERTFGAIVRNSLLNLTVISPYLRVIYYVIVLGMAVLGILTLALRNYRGAFWIRCKTALSLLLGAASVLIFTVSLQPYPAVLMFVFLLIKILVTVKKK